MIRRLLLCTLFASSLALADKKEEAQKKMDEASAKACQIAKDTIAKEEACSEENGKMSAVDCADKDQRKASDYMKLNSACMKKTKAGAKKK